MCGILGEFIYDNDLTERDQFLSLLARSKLRGPDSSGYFSNNINEYKIESVNLWFLTQLNSPPNVNKNYKVTKKELPLKKRNSNMKKRTTKNKKKKNVEKQNIINIIKNNKKKNKK